MTQMMKAAVLHELRTPLKIEQVPVPEPGHGDLLIKVTACGVCHSDLHAVDGDWTPPPVIPLIPGHEVAGKVAKVGPGVTGFKVGDEVGVPWALRDAASVLSLIGLSAQADQPAAAITPSQQRLLEIGMALATRPKLLLLDEVAAGLTESEIEEMARLIRRLRDELDLTVIWIEHAVTTLLRHVERVIVLHQGRKIADDTPVKVVRNPEVIEAYLGDEMAEPAADSETAKVAA